MKRINRISEKNFIGIELQIGERLETFCERLESTSQEIPCERAFFYQENADELLAETDIRTDKWTIAQRALDKLHNEKRKQSEKMKKQGLQNDVEKKVEKDMEENQSDPTDN